MEIAVGVAVVGGLIALMFFVARYAGPGIFTLWLTMVLSSCSM